MTPRGKRSIALITALLAVLLALGIPAGASSGNANTSSEKVSQHDSRDESADDHDHGYGNDDREGKDKDKDKDKDKEVVESTPDTVIDHPDDADTAVEIDPPTETDTEPVVDEPIDADAPVDSESPTDPDEVIDPPIDDSPAEEIEPNDSLEETDGIANDVVTAEPPADTDSAVTEPTDSSTATTDTPEAGSVEVVDPIEDGSSIVGGEEELIESATEEPDAPETTVETVTPSDQKPSETAQSEKSASKTDRDESAADHDKGYGNDDREPKVKEDRAQEPPADVATPDVDPAPESAEVDTSTDQAPESAPEPAEVDTTTDQAPESAPEPAEVDTTTDQAPESAPEPAEVDTTTDQAPVSAPKPAESPDASSAQSPRNANTPVTVSPIENNLVVLAIPVPAGPVQATEVIDPDPEVAFLLTTERVQIAQSALTATSAPSAAAPNDSFLAPLGRMLLQPAGVALIDLLAATDAPVLNRASSESVTDAAQQAAGLVAVPAAAVTALTLLGWAVKPAAIKVSAFVAGRIG